MNPLPELPRPGQPSSSSSCLCFPSTPLLQHPFPCMEEFHISSQLLPRPPIFGPGGYFVGVCCRQMSSFLPPTSHPCVIKFSGHGPASHMPFSWPCGVKVCVVSSRGLKVSSKWPSASRERRGSCSWSNYHLHVPKAGSRC